MKGPLQPAVGPRRGDARAARYRRIAHWIIAVWAILVAPLEFWGLPSRDCDSTLFAGRAPWTAQQYGLDAALAARADRVGGADTDLNPLLNRNELVLLTATEADRAEIVRRFRLYSRQPDEMITFMALQRMRPRAGDFDPRLYQYGGGYIYSVGALLGVGALTGLVALPSRADEFLVHPERFGRYYLLSRGLTLAFAIMALFGVARLAPLLGHAAAAPLAVLLLACSPLFLTTATEAKPHLPSAAWWVWSAVALLEYERRGRRRWALLAGLFAGLSFGFVLTGLAALLPFIALLFFARRLPESERPPRRLYRSDLILGLLLALGVFALLNPYLIYNLVLNRAALAGNLGNSTAMYVEQFTQFARGAVRTFVLIHESCGWLTPLVGLAGVVALFWQRTRAAAVLVSAGGAILLLACFLGAHKPAEFARFLLIPSVVLALGVATLIAPLKLVHAALPWSIAVLLICFSRAPAYAWSLAQDVRGSDSRAAAAEWLLGELEAEDTLGVLQEPAPYATPPIDFHRREVVLLPQVAPAVATSNTLPPWLVYTADDESVYRHAWWQPAYRLERTFPADPWYSRITWANKPVFVYRLREAPPPPQMKPEPPPAPATAPVPAPTSAPQSQPASVPSEAPDGVG